MSISGFSYVRNAIELDFCIELCIKSMLPWVDELIICDSDSTDGTREFLEKWALEEPKLRIVNKPWTDPVARLTWVRDWMRFAQGFCQFPNMLYLDADEVLCPESGPLIHDIPQGEARTFRRINYWRDVHHEAPFGTVCAERVIRFGPSNVPCCTDEIYSKDQINEPEPEIRRLSKVDDRLVVHHYGFLRKQAPMLKKIRRNLRAFFGQGQDARLIEMEQEIERNIQERHWTELCPFKKPLIKTSGQIPELARQWLQDRNAL